MLTFLKNLFESKPAVDPGELIRKGAIIIDVRSKGEYQGGHLKGSVNLPLRNLGDNLHKISKSKPIIVCCASGARSASARSILRANGFNEVYNAGSWTSLRKYCNG